MSVQAVAAERTQLGISRATLHRIEAGQTSVRAATVRALCSLYRADASVTDALAELARGTSEEQWWDSSPLIPPWRKLYLGLEASAARICSYDGEGVPGELQTEDYARAALTAARVDDDVEQLVEIDQLVKLRAERRRTLFGRAPVVQLVTVLGEGALTRPVGGPEVLAEQVDYLRQVARRDHVQILVLPWSAGAHPGMAGRHRILDFTDELDPDVVAIESLLGVTYLEQPDEVAKYRHAFEKIMTSAVPIGQYR